MDTYDVPRCSFRCEIPFFSQKLSALAHSAADDDCEEEEEYPSHVANEGVDFPKTFKVKEIPLF